MINKFSKKALMASIFALVFGAAAFAAESVAAEEIKPAENNIVAEAMNEHKKHDGARHGMKNLTAPHSYGYKRHHGRHFNYHNYAAPNSYVPRHSYAPHHSYASPKFHGYNGHPHKKYGCSGKGNWSRGSFPAMPKPSVDGKTSAEAQPQVDSQPPAAVNR